MCRARLADELLVVVPLRCSLGPIVFLCSPDSPPSLGPQRRERDVFHSSCLLRGQGVVVHNSSACLFSERDGPWDVAIRGAVFGLPVHLDGHRGLDLLGAWCLCREAVCAAGFCRKSRSTSDPWHVYHYVLALDDDVRVQSGRASQPFRSYEGPGLLALPLEPYYRRCLLLQRWHEACPRGRGSGEKTVHPPLHIPCLSLAAHPASHHDVFQRGFLASRGCHHGPGQLRHVWRAPVRLLAHEVWSSL
mmetsp:Transcript_71561/g.115504  ORF Transcript_71561/g.115504 Transcript_71561/m.115504 type:complete len:247 (+) Transcript_71561:88-828(+)